MTKTFTNKKGISYLFLDVPEDARDFKVFNDEMPYLSYFNIFSETPREYLPKGNYELIGLAKDVSESQAAEIVHEYDELSLEGHGFEDYIGTSICDTAKESLSSLVQSLCLNNAIILKKI